MKKLFLRSTSKLGELGSFLGQLRTVSQVLVVDSIRDTPSTEFERQSLVLNVALGYSHPESKELIESFRDADFILTNQTRFTFPEAVLNRVDLPAYIKLEYGYNCQEGEVRKSLGTFTQEVLEQIPTDCGQILLEPPAHCILFKKA